jgi:hypothetical protein
VVFWKKERRNIMSELRDNMARGAGAGLMAGIIGAIVMYVLSFFFSGPPGSMADVLKNCFKISAFILLVGCPMYGSLSKTGLCPYCQNEIVVGPTDNATTCKACQNRLLVQNNQLTKITQ